MFNKRFSISDVCEKLNGYGSGVRVSVPKLNCDTQLIRGQFNFKLFASVLEGTGSEYTGQKKEKDSLAVTPEST